MNEYIFIIAISTTVILSFLFSRLSQKTNIPSVLMLISLGILLKHTIEFFELPLIDLFPILGTLGVVGLIMIVLEAAIDLELRKDKLPLILTSLSVATLSLGATAFGVALVFKHLLDVDYFTSFLYSIPLSIMSSAIVIPSVVNMDEHKREFMIYESAFSDILGIMAFNFLISSAHAGSATEVVVNIFTNISFTIVISLIVSYILIIMIQNINSNIKLFLLVSILMFLYSVEKLLHLSSLITILFFGLMLRNPHVFFRGNLEKYINRKALNNAFANFKVIIIESSFLVRTFFFVIFGMAIVLTTLLNLKVLFLSILVILSIYVSRLLILRLHTKEYWEKTLIAPRGLITILLFYAIPDEFTGQIPEDIYYGVLLFVIITSSLFMAYSLIKFKNSNES